MASPGKKAFALRVDPALWAEVERAAAQELRSVNAQVEMLLREALARRGVRLAAPRPRGGWTEETPGPPQDAGEG